MKLISSHRLLKQVSLTGFIAMQLSPVHAQNTYQYQPQAQPQQQMQQQQMMPPPPQQGMQQMQGAPQPGMMQQQQQMMPQQQQPGMQQPMQQPGQAQMPQQGMAQPTTAINPDNLCGGKPTCEITVSGSDFYNYLSLCTKLKGATIKWPVNQFYTMSIKPNNAGACSLEVTTANQLPITCTFNSEQIMQMTNSQAKAQISQYEKYPDPSLLSGVMKPIFDCIGQTSIMKNFQKMMPQGQGMPGMQQPMQQPAQPMQQPAQPAAQPVQQTY